MNRGILSVKIMILGAVLFLAGWEFAYDGGIGSLICIIAGPVVMLIGLLTGNKKEKNEDDKT